MFQTLSGDETAERMLTIMETVLPPAVVAFLTPDTDAYTTVLTGGPDSHRPIQPIPVQALAALRRAPVPTPQQSGRRLPLYDVLAGSNAWAVNHAKTVDGRAILANDMHLQFSVPNIWYRVALRYGKTDIAGVLLPGVPLIVAGSNGHVAWGMTNSNSDVLDLIRLEINPANPEEYRTPGGWKRFEVVSEVIQVKGSKPQLTEVKHTIWGPVRPQPLLGAPVALRWTALQPQAVDIGLLHMDQATTLPEAIEISSRLRGPPLHVLIADQQGRIAWTSSGRIPVRQGFDGSVSLSWAHGGVGWQAYIPPEMLPRIIDPAPGFLVTANNRLLGKAYPYVLGHNFAHSYRAYHISQRLRAMDRLTEQDMFRLQLDTTSHFYDFYHQLALAVLPETAPDAPPLFAALRQHLRAWDGQATVESVGFALLVRFRALLLTDVFAPFLGQCQEADAEFSYVWRNQETPLRMLLTARSPDLLPVPEQYATWEAFIRGKLLDSLQQLQNEYRVSSPEQLTWGRINTAYIVHPLAEALPVLGRLLNMPQEALPGCTYCIRTTRADWGASKRLVVSPGHLTQGILHMPGGQSGHPLSPHYRDQHRFWVQGKPLPFLPGLPIHTLILRPATQQMPPDRGQP
jgi:penicillin amidase